MKQATFMNEYCQAIDHLHGQRPDILWFSTWMSSKAPYFGYAQKFETFWQRGEIPGSLSFVSRIRKILRLTVTLFSLIGKSLFLRIVYRHELKALQSLSQITVLRTFSYSAAAEAEDPFWGPLVDELQLQKNPLVVVFEPQFSIFKCKKTYSSQKRNFPYYVFLNALNLFKSYLQLVQEGFSEVRFQTPPDQKKGIHQILQQNYQEEILSPAALGTLAFYDCFLNITSNFSIFNFYITFENNPWEKMLYLVRQVSKQPFQITGFQHATIQRDAANYYLSDYESKRHLHPDIIYCVGSITTQLLKSYSHYRQLPVREGCALRYNLPLKKKYLKQFSTKIQILVTLDGTKAEAKALLDLVIKYSLNQRADIHFVIKEHPNMRIKDFSSDALTRIAQKDNLSIANGSLYEALNESDILLYSCTTVCLEALAQGIPLIQFGNSLLNLDPLFNFTEYKITVQDISQLDRALKNFRAMSQDERSQREELGRKFVEEYFSPCTPDAIKRFLGPQV